MTVSTRTACPLDCPDSCSLEVSVDGGRLTEIRSAPAREGTRGFICSKVARFGERVYHRDRLLSPMRRVGTKGTGTFEPITWDQAIAQITNRFRDIRDRWGGEAILPYHYGGSNGLMTDESADSEYFARLGASRLAKTICAAPTSTVATAMYGKMPGVAFDDFVHARCIIVWGANPKASNIHLTPFLREAKRRGAFIAAVDPKRNFSGSEIDLHLPVYPGTDLPVALAMIREWRRGGLLDQGFLEAHARGWDSLLEQAEAWPLDRAGAEARVDPEDIERLAAAYARSAPAVVRVGWGLERNRNGGQAAAAILGMPALLGKFGVRGGGYTLSNSGAAEVDRERWFSGTPWQSRSINMTQLGEVLNGAVDPPVKAIFVYNCNPVATVPDQNAVIAGLARDDLFTVVFEQVMTDTARFADVVLPATTFLEHDDIRRAYGRYYVGRVRPAITPRGEARSNPAVFGALGRAMGWHCEPFTWDESTWLERTAAALDLSDRPAPADSLVIGDGTSYDFPGETPVQFVTALPQTADAKVDLAPTQLGRPPYRYQPLADGQFPLALISPANNKMISSTLAEFNYPELWLSINPEDAAHRQIEAKTAVRVFNALGEVVCRARLSNHVRPGVVSLPKGAWQQASRNDRTSTALCPPTISEVGGGACFNDARVDVRPAED